jgi:hypothetical protein
VVGTPQVWQAVSLRGNVAELMQWRKFRDSDNFVAAAKAAVSLVAPNGAGVIALRTMGAERLAPRHFDAGAKVWRCQYGVKIQINVPSYSA